MRSLLVALLCLSAAPACAGGFALRDLTAVADEAGATRHGPRRSGSP